MIKISFYDFIRKHADIIFDIAILIFLFLFLLNYFDIRYIFLDTTPTGGDIPAHNYLVKHLKESFFSHGKVISWAKGWWCGFPMYQYYFFFPYLMMAILSFVIPMTIAFKIISISGILFLPVSVYISLKQMKFESPVPILGSASMILYLFVDTHTMWGVNIYSTLAGEISNSISFIFFVLFMGSIFRDAEECRFRLYTVVLFTLLFYSHFFTTVIAGVMCFFLIFLFGRQKIRERLVVLIKTGALTFLLVSWWFIPLVAKLDYSVEFGGDWDVKLLKTFPAYVVGIIPFIIFALIRTLKTRQKNVIFIFLMLLIAVCAFYTGGRINDSFTNIRFWPFIFYAFIILASAGAGYFALLLRAKKIVVVLIMCAILFFIESTPNNVRAWVKWNYAGLEEKSGYPVIRDLVLPLDSTPGRLANDLHEYNNNLGSTRIFETVPYLIKKDILEGGIVNSASGSMFSYYIQGETSKSSAGFPSVVNPATFNIENATRHLKLANVKHFIAYWDKTRQALKSHPEWKLLKTSGAYQLFELKTNNGRYVDIPKNLPVAVRTTRWKETAMEWIYSIEAIDTPFVLLYDDIKPDETSIMDVFSEEDYLNFLSGLSQRKENISAWLNLGPFYFSPDISEEKAIAADFVDIQSLNPIAGHKEYEHIWKPILRSGPIFLDGLYKPKYYFVCYNYVNIHSEKQQKALLHYSNDDRGRIYLNNKLIVDTPFTGLNNYKIQEIMLEKGDNPLVYKIEQSVGGAFFHAKITDLNHKPIDNVRYLISKETNSNSNIFSKRLLSESIATDSASMISEETVTDQEIRFKTKALHAPHIIKYSYFPNWKVKGAKRIYHVTPNFMLVYPEQEEVTLYYGSLFPDVLGRILTVFGALVFIGAGIFGKSNARSIKFIDATLGKALCLFFGYIDYLFRLQRPWRSGKWSTIGDFLFIRPGGMGDFLYLLPAIKTLKTYFPESEVCVLVEKRNKFVLGLSDHIDRVLVYDEQPLKTLYALISKKYEVVIDTEQFHNMSAVLAYLTRAKIRIGFKTNALRNNLYTHLIDYTIFSQEARQFMSLLSPLGIDNEDVPFESSIKLDAVRDASLPKEFSELKAQNERIVIIAPRGEEKYRYWEAEKYQEVIRYLLSHTGYGVVLVGGRAEAKSAAQISKGLNLEAPTVDRFVTLVEKTSFPALCRIFLESDLFIGCDSGTAVLACILNTSRIVLFGLNYETKWGREGDNQRIIRKSLPCSPCYMLGKQKLCKNIDCMAQISAADVISEIQKMGF